MKGSMLRWVFVALAAGGMNTAGAQMSRAELKLGEHRVEVEIAANNADRQSGLMYRTRLPVDRGMVFVFPEAIRICMWMKNTLIPLSVAFFDDEGRILNIEDMAPQSEDSHCSATPARHALEMNKGWFDERGIKAGDRVEGIRSLPVGR